MLIATALALAAFGWVRSHLAMDALHWHDGRRVVTLMSSGGRVNYTESVWPNDTAWPRGWAVSSKSRANVAELPLWEADPDIYGRRRFLGFEWSEDLPPWPSNQREILSFFQPTYRLIAVPYWAMALLAALPLARPAMTALRARAWLRQGRCRRCGYDLRAKPSLCPECGWSSVGATGRASAAGSAVPM